MDQWSGEGRLLNCCVPNGRPTNLSCLRGFQLNSNLAFRIDTNRMVCVENTENNRENIWRSRALRNTVVTSSRRAFLAFCGRSIAAFPVSAARWGRHAGGCRGAGGIRRCHHPGVSQVHRHALRACRCVRRGHHGRGRIDIGAAKLTDDWLYRAGWRVRRNLRR
jgi:hypothetical protein